MTQQVAFRRSAVAYAVGARQSGGAVHVMRRFQVDARAASGHKWDLFQAAVRAPGPQAVRLIDARGGTLASK